MLIKLYFNYYYVKQSMFNSYCAYCQILFVHFFAVVSAVATIFVFTK